MNKQSRSAYTSLINRIAVAMLLNQVIIAVLSLIVIASERIADNVLGGLWWADMVCRLEECIVYILGFTVPIVVFDKIGKGSETEIYMPVENGYRLSRVQTVLAILAALGAISLAAYVNYHAVNIFGNYSDFSSEYIWDVELYEPYQIIIYFVHAAIIPALVEELLFRETICRSLRAYGDKTAILISALLFSLMHTNAEQIIYTFVAGLFLAWIYERTKNVIFPMIVHFINNGLSALKDIIEVRCSESLADAFSSVSESAILLLGAVSAACLLLILRKSGGVFSEYRLKPDENGEEVLPLTAKEKMSGFFTPPMMMFILYSVLTMVSYIFLSFMV